MTPDRDTSLERLLDTRTRADSETVNAASNVEVPVLTLLWHSDAARVGERAWLPELEDG